jgi:hypothetical protein
MTRHPLARGYLLACGLALGAGIVLGIRTAQTKATPTGDGIGTRGGEGNFFQQFRQ